MSVSPVTDYYEHDAERPYYTADVVCFRPGPGGPELLVIQRGWDPHKGWWALPGGHVDAGETSRVAAARELAEESGVQADPEALVLVGVYDAPGRDPRGRYVTVAYRAEVLPCTPARAGDDASAVRWVPLDALDPLAFDHDQIVADAVHQPTTR